jgi:hypothetical protein
MVKAEQRGSTRERREVKSVYTDAIAEEEERKRNAILNDNKRTSSTVPLRGAGNYEGAGSAGAAKKKKKESTAEKEMSERIGKESAAEKEMRQRIERAEAKLKEFQFEIAENFKKIYESAGMLDRGGNNRGSFEGDDEMVGPAVDGASEMMIATNSIRSKKQIAKSESNLQNRPSLSNGRLANWNATPENRRIFGTLVYKWQQENNNGCAKWNKEHSHDLFTDIPLRTLQLPHLLTMGAHGEYFEFVEVPEDWDEKKK